MTEFLTSIMPNVMDRLPDFYQAIGDTLIMVGWSGSIAFVLGLFLGIVLTVTKPGGILEQKVVYQVLDKFVNFFRPIPFIILFIRKIFAVVRKWSATFEKLISKVEAKAYKHQDMIDKYAAMGLFILTAVPLPGTGAWTASLLATLMDMRLSRAFFPIALGVVAAGTIMAILSFNSCCKCCAPRRWRFSGRSVTSDSSATVFSSPSISERCDTGD